MKRLFTKRFMPGLALSSIVLLSALACNFLGDGEDGRLSVCFDGYYRTKSLEELPDTNEFILNITGPDGEKVYSGRFADSPESFVARPGSYVISVRSSENTKPGFSNPVFGDDQCVIVPSGGKCKAVMKCVQVNCGVRLRFAADFRRNCDGIVYITSKDGRLLYGSSESRVAYFNPGEICVMLDNDGKETLLFKRQMRARDMLDMGISAPDVHSSDKDRDISISIDTSRNWTSDEFVIGGGSNRGDSKEAAFSIAEAKSNIGASGKWVYGFIVGSFKSSSNLLFDPPFTSATNIAIAGRRSVSDKNSCMSLELRKGKLRTELNLLDNPANLKRKLYVKGDIVEAYYGIPGIKNITEYALN